MITGRVCYNGSMSTPSFTLDDLQRVAPQVLARLRGMAELPDYGTVAFHADGRVSAEGRTLDPEAWSIAGKAIDLPLGALGPGQ